MKYVCILQSVTAHDHFYTGIADDLDTTLSKHNLGEVAHTQVSTVARQDVHTVHRWGSRVGI
jgi:predicted GIY-YIG superfamily endonuclease